ncbi:hypothetical protein QFC20_007266 [Naganishia adeliensis]|uniref:Uncharacterized protein n=1 Tax=Naganishia adeliensis TaxID=92952 RepID=A0ACC2V170_9TREE|nr:hypothetical protein QFC20_007266 [Naganishia adeliensis]
MLPTLKSSITPDMDLLNFRRILLNYEKGLRWNGPWNSRRQDNHASARPYNGASNDRFKNNGTPAPGNRDFSTKDASKPPGPSTPIGFPSPSPDGLRRRKDTAKPIKVSRSLKHRMDLVTIEEEDERVIEISLPKQDNDGFDELSEPLGLSRDYEETICNNTVSSDSSLQHRHSDKVPTFAMAKIGNKEGVAHEVCIDTGSAISLIDSLYLKRNFSSIKVNPSSTIMLKGVGNNQTHGWVNADIHFVNKEKDYTSITGAFHVVTSLAKKIIIGNDLLAEEGALIDLKEGTCSFKSSGGTIPIISIRPKVLSSSQPSTQGSIIFSAFGAASKGLHHQAGFPGKGSYLCEDIQVSRSILVTNAVQHYTHVMNVRKNVVKLPADITLARVMAVQDSRHNAIVSNVVDSESPADLQAFEEALQEIDINIDLKKEEKELLINTIPENRQAFSYATRRLGRTGLATMTIETGTAPPVCQAPY